VLLETILRASAKLIASLGMNRTTFLSRMKKFGIYAKQYA
jgi:transcriptional regulator of acetoin/glycerol metabolism